MNAIDFMLMLNNKTEEINKMINLYLPVEEGFQKSVFEAVNYSVRAGGKRIRPLFMLESFLIFSAGDKLKEDAYKLLPNFIAAMEMIHTYSLVHDDLPAMDNDMYRRGNLTTHAKYGEALGILAGDGLLNLAYETAAGAFYNVFDRSSILYERILKALNVLSKKSGIYGMIGGQTVDIEKSGKASDINELKFIYQLKTGALLEASFVVGAVLGGAGEEELKKLNQIAGDIGMAFQIQDDILDAAGDVALMGKPVYSDEKNGKTTYVTLFSIEEAVYESERLSKRALEELEKLMKDIECKADLKNCSTTDLKPAKADMGHKDEKIFLRELIISLIHRKK